VKIATLRCAEIDNIIDDLVVPSEARGVELPSGIRREQRQLRLRESEQRKGEMGTHFGEKRVHWSRRRSELAPDACQEGGSLGRCGDEARSRPGKRAFAEMIDSTLHPIFVEQREGHRQRKRAIMRLSGGFDILDGSFKGRGRVSQSREQTRGVASLTGIILSIR
jgi:hypothetical protein